MIIMHSMFHGQQSALRKAQCHHSLCFFQGKEKEWKTARSDFRDPLGKKRIWLKEKYDLRETGHVSRSSVVGLYLFKELINVQHHGKTSASLPTI